MAQGAEGRCGLALSCAHCLFLLGPFGVTVWVATRSQVLSAALTGPQQVGMVTQLPRLLPGADGETGRGLWLCCSVLAPCPSPLGTWDPGHGT